MADLATKQGKQENVIQNGNVPKIEKRDDVRKTNNKVNHLKSNASDMIGLITEVNSEGKDQIKVFYNAKTSNNVELHSNAALQSKELITVLCSMLGMKIPDNLKNASVKDLIGHAPGIQSGPWTDSRLENFYKHCALISKTIFDAAVSNDPAFAKKYDKQKYKIN